MSALEHIQRQTRAAFWRGFINGVACILVMAASVYGTGRLVDWLLTLH